MNETASKVRMQASGMKIVEVRKEQRVECARVVVNQHGTDIVSMGLSRSLHGDGFITEEHLWTHL